MWSQLCSLNLTQFMYIHATDICHVVDISYQNIPYPLLCNYLGDVEENTIADLVAKHGWRLKSDGGEEGGTKVVVIKNQEATIRPKKILAKIEFDSERGGGGS